MAFTTHCEIGSEIYALCLEDDKYELVSPQKIKVYEVMIIKSGVYYYTDQGIFNQDLTRETKAEVKRLRTKLNEQLKYIKREIKRNANKISKRDR